MALHVALDISSTTCSCYWRRPRPHDLIYIHSLLHSREPHDRRFLRIASDLKIGSNSRRIRRIATPGCDCWKSARIPGNRPAQYSCKSARIPENRRDFSKWTQLFWNPVRLSDPATMICNKSTSSSSACSHTVAALIICPHPSDVYHG